MEHKLYCGDCLEVMGQFPAASIDAVITDPPYIIGAVSAGNMSSKTGTWADMMNSAYWFQAWYERVWNLLRPTGCFWTFLNWKTMPVVMKAAISLSIPITSMLIWDKKWIGPGGQRGLRPRYEMIALMAKPDFVIPDRGVPDIWEFLWPATKPTGHPAEKPVDLIYKIIQTSALPEGATILDPFMGSGTTGVACHKAGLKFIGIEQDEAFFEMARKRIEAATNQEMLELGF
jgi:site-specific DNA-methyltransferase (adenine-specific)